MKENKRYQWSYVGSDRVILPGKDYVIIDTNEGIVVESYNSASMVKYRLSVLNKHGKKK